MITCDPRMILKLKRKGYKTITRLVVMYGSECWVIKETDERKWHVAEIPTLRYRIEYIPGGMKIAPVTKKLKTNRLVWYGYVMRRDENHITSRMV